MTAGISNNLVRQVNVPPPGVKRRAVTAGSRPLTAGKDQHATRKRVRYLTKAVVKSTVLVERASGCE
ncbi:hypothetical protein XO70_09550 [Salmonella enterica subsp. enterica]|nr:hypothetical protein [Salmonella enterica subsp. enterica serovar Javiana]